MNRLRKIIMVSLVMMLCCGGMISAASAEMVKKIVLFGDGVTDQERSQYAQGWEPQGVSTLMDLPFMNAMVLSVPDTITSADLADDYRVASVEEDQQVELQSIEATGEGGAGEGGATSFITPADAPPSSYRPWGVLHALGHHYDPPVSMDTEELEDICNQYNIQNMPPIVRETLSDKKKLKNLKVAVFDTGIDLQHPSFNTVSQILGGIDLVHMTAGIPADDNGHGTHVAGTFCGKFLGISEAMKLYVVKVLDENATGDISTMIMGLQWVIDQGVKIVNMSFAFREDNPAVRLAVQKANEAGLIMVAAVGNHSNWEDDGATGEGGAGEGGAGEGGAADDGTTGNPYPVMYPAAYPEVIAVGAHDPFGNVATFSNTGPELDVTAPGVNVISTNKDSGFGICNGTSMATPHVSGIVALMLALDTDNILTAADINSILKQTAQDGKLNTVGAIEEVQMR